MRFYALEKLINLSDGYSRRFHIDHYQLLLVQRQGQRYLFDAYCPHRHHPLNDAIITDAVIECPRHRYQFDLNSGRLIGCREEPCRDLCVYVLIYEGNEVGVLLDR